MKNKKNIINKKSVGHKRSRSISYGIIIFFFTFASNVYGASIFVSDTPNIKTGDTFPVTVNLDTGQESINTVEVVLDFNEDLLSFAGYKDDESVIKLWVESPYEKQGQVYFSGIIPGGVNGVYDAETQSGLRAIPLVDLLFVARGEGLADFVFTESKVLKNDGLGTSLFLESKQSSLSIEKQLGSSAPNTALNVDETPPEPFDISFIPASIFSKTPSMIMFSTNDLQSGIKEYQTKVSSGSWKQIKSPQPIRPSLMSRTVTVRAYDFNDNFTDASITIPGSHEVRFLIIVLVLFISGIWAYKLLK